LAEINLRAEDVARKQHILRRLKLHNRHRIGRDLYVSLTNPVVAAESDHSGRRVGIDGAAHEKGPGASRRGPGSGCLPRRQALTQ
jgi:hypothetical protein